MHTFFTAQYWPEAVARMLRPISNRTSLDDFLEWLSLIIIINNIKLITRHTFFTAQYWPEVLA
jgi:hypothetical protein